MQTGSRRRGFEETRTRTDNYAKMRTFIVILSLREISLRTNFQYVRGRNLITGEIRNGVNRISSMMGSNLRLREGLIGSKCQRLTKFWFSGESKETGWKESWHDRSRRNYACRSTIVEWIRCLSLTLVKICIDLKNCSISQRVITDPSEASSISDCSQV